MYTDRIEFTSIGGLLKGITLEDIRLGISVCQNPKLANIFYRLELIEAMVLAFKRLLIRIQNLNSSLKFATTENAFKNYSSKSKLSKEKQ